MKLIFLYNTVQNILWYLRNVYISRNVEIRFIIYRSDLNNLQTRQKRAKKYQLVEIELSINGHTKSFEGISKYKYCHRLGTCRNGVQFKNPISVIYWCAKRRKSTLHMLVYNPIKAIFVFLTVSETQCIVYRPDLHNSQASRKKLKK